MSLKDFKSVIDFSKSLNHPEMISEEVYNKAFHECAIDLKNQLKKFYEYCYTNQIDLNNIDNNFIISVLVIDSDMISYFKNILSWDLEIAINNKDIDVLHYILEFHCDFNEKIIRKLDNQEIYLYNTYQKSYSKDISDRILALIKISLELSMFIRNIIQKINIDRIKLFEILNKLIDNESEIVFLFTRLSKVNENNSDKDEAIFLLKKLELPMVNDIINRSQQFFAEQRWDISVAEIRKAFELTVTSLVCRILNNKGWNSPVKDGLEILLQNNVISSKSIKIHFNAPHTGLYGLLSIMGIHPDGSSTENFAKNDLEATYCLSLAKNGIIYLLNSYI